MIPPGVVPQGVVEDPEGGDPPQSDPDPEVIAPVDDDLEGVPPVPDGDLEQPPGGSGADPDDEYEEIDPDEFRQGILDEVQKRFDRSISRLVRKGTLRLDQPGTPPGEGGNGGGETPPPTQSRQVDALSIRSYARSCLNDAMEGAGKTEKQAVRKVLDNLVAHVDWSTVDDEEEYVEQLVEDLTKTSSALIKVGSDRKVQQLQASGVLPRRVQQPGQAAAPTHSAQTGMAKGAAVAKKRWPTGRRRMTG